VTVFIVPPRYVALKIGDQLLGRGEGVVTFLATEVPMITFACLIVEPQNALAIYDVCEPVLERVIRSSKGFRYSPENQLGERAFRVNNSSPEKFHGLHVGEYANTWPLLSMATTRAGSCYEAKLLRLLRAAGTFLNYLTQPALLMSASAAVAKVRARGAGPEARGGGISRNVFPLASCHYPLPDLYRISR
jgi:hypothetical protein